MRVTTVQLARGRRAPRRAFFTRLRKTWVSCARSPTHGREARVELGAQRDGRPTPAPARCSVSTSFRTRWMLTAVELQTRRRAQSSRSCSTRPSSRSTSRTMMSVQRICSGSVEAGAQELRGALDAAERVADLVREAERDGAERRSGGRRAAWWRRACARRVRSCRTSTAPRTAPCVVVDGRAAPR